MPGPVDGIDAGPRAQPREIGLELADRGLAARLARREGPRLLVEGRDLGPELVVARVEVRDEHGQLLRRQRAKPGSGLGADLDDDEHAQQKRDQSDRHGVPTAAHQGVAPAGDGEAPADGEALATGGPGLAEGTGRAERRLTIPA